MKTLTEDWDQIRLCYLDVLLRLRSNNIDMSVAESCIRECCREDEVQKFLVDLISEVDGYSDAYDEVLVMLSAGLTRDRFLDYINS